MAIVMEDRFEYEMFIETSQQQQRAEPFADEHGTYSGR